MVEQNVGHVVLFWVPTLKEAVPPPPPLGYPPPPPSTHTPPPPVPGRHAWVPPLIPARRFHLYETSGAEQAPGEAPTSGGDKFGSNRDAMKVYGFVI